MINKNIFQLPICLLPLLALPVLGDLPYNPSRVLVTQNGTSAYLFSSQSSSTQFQLSRLNISATLDPSSPDASTLASNLPFLSDSSARAFVPVLNDEGDITVLAGDCGTERDGSQLWRFTPNGDGRNGSWSQLSITSSDTSLGANFLSASLSFSPTASTRNASMYVFGGMCLNSTSPASPSGWTKSATYSNKMLTLSPEPASRGTPSSTKYDLSLSASRGPPIAEAGLSMTPLLPSFTNTTSSTVSQQQNFVLLGGHTEQAFINMSQVALFSLPEQSWAFLGVNQPNTGEKTDLMSRVSDHVVESRSGHTALLTEDGSKIILFGGWVGDISTPADPQLAVLEVGQGYGGAGDWTWTIPSVTGNPLKAGEGIYGHGASMLPGGVMMIMGGYNILSSSKLHSRQDSQIANPQMFLFNTTSSSWISSYTNPGPQNAPGQGSAAPSTGGVLSTSSEKVGLGAGLTLGFAAIIGVVVVYLLYSRRLRQKRQLREKELRDLALGAERFHSPGGLLGGGVDGRGGSYPGVRSASWGSRQEKHIGMGAGDNDYPWAPVLGAGSIRKVEEDSEEHHVGNGKRGAERTGLLVEIPSPTRGLRRGMHSRGPNGYGANLGVMGGGQSSAYGSGHGPNAPGGIHRIDETEEEISEVGSVRKKKAALPSPLTIGTQRYSDPFKDPPQLGDVPDNRSASDVARQRREREVQGWVEGWSAAAAALDISRTGSQAHSHRPTASSHSGSLSRSGGTSSGRGSPDKSDRTGSNLSEQSMVSSTSIQRSAIGSISRNMSMRSATTGGYHLFTSAAAAVANRVPGMAGRQGEDGPRREALARAPSKRSASLNMNSNASSRRRRSDTFSTARTSFDPTEREALLSMGRPGSCGRGLDDDGWATPPESPAKEKANPLTGGRRALGWMGSVKRVLSGAKDDGVRNRYAEFEPRSGTPSPTKESQMMEVSQDGSNGAAGTSAAFWRGKKGARDWNEDASPPYPGADGVAGSSASNVLRRNSVAGEVMGQLKGDGDDDAGDDGDGEEWDVEAAVERRVVQVMFTVPKEKLRVVNADALSVLSKSDVDFEGVEVDANEDGGREKKKEKEMKEDNRVSVVVEEAEEDVGKDMGERKGKRVARD